MKKYLIAASVSVIALTAAATSANAADIIQQAPVYTAPAFSWTGFYVGAAIGGTWADSSLRTKWNDYNYLTGAVNEYGHGDVRKSPDPSGFMGGLYLGYNYEIGNNFVLGVETDFNWMDADDTKSTALYSYAGDLDLIGTQTGTLKSKLKQKWAGSTRVRLGYAMDRWMPFITGGVAYSKIESSARFKNLYGTTTSSYSGSNTHTGWTIGTGVDYAVTDNVLLRLEYRYTDYGSKNEKFNEYFTNGSVESTRLRTNYKTNDFRVGVAYKF